jgi:hypothetical protein
MILRKRNPTVERFKSVRRRGVPTGSGARPPPPPVPRLPPIAAGESYQPPTQKEIVTSPYGHHSQEPYSLPFRTNSGHEIPAAAQASAAIQSSTISNPSYPPALFARKPVHSPSDSPHRTTSPQSLEHGQYHVQPSQAERQFSTGSVSTLPRSDTPPSRKGSADQGLKRQSKALHRKSIANMGPAMRYQQRQSQQSPQGSMDVLTESHDFAATAEAPPAASAIATPPPAPYSPYPPQQQYHPPPPPALPPRQSQYFNVPPQPEYFHSQQFHQPQQSPYPGPPPSQYQPYASPPIQGQGYPQYGQPPHVTPQPVYQGNHHVSNTPPVGQSFAWEMPVTSQGQPHRPSEAQARTWGTGGYDGAGYGT